MDRTVHARTLAGTLVVRYDRAGKWYAEHRSGKRFPLTLDEAVAMATEPGARVYFRRPGGRVFDARVRVADAKARRGRG